jgi:muconolactone delta-isomerase
MPAMEYLVTMTTLVPDGTAEEAVEEIRTRETDRASELAGQGHLRRLWRPPLQPGEWRSLGLFAASDEAELEDVLASMPLRVWRSDQVLPLSAHPNDPPLSVEGTGVEFLTTFEVTFPGGTSEQEVADIKAREADRTRELAGQGHLVRLWLAPPTPGTWRAIGLWRAEDGEQMQALLRSLPMDKWMTTETTPLTDHPNDPGADPALPGVRPRRGPATQPAMVGERTDHQSGDRNATYQRRDREQCPDRDPL